jgi:hypothetical protein
MTRAKLIAWAKELRDRYLRAQTPARILQVSAQIDQSLDAVHASAEACKGVPL